MSACASDDIVEERVPDIDLTWEEELLPGASVTLKGFECGDAVSRASWEFNGQKMVFGWESGDAIGLYPTAGTATSSENWEADNPTLVNPEEKKHPLFEQNICLTKDGKAQPTRFDVKEPVKILRLSV